MESDQHRATQQSMEGKPKKPRKERTKKDNSGTEPKKPKRTTKKESSKAALSEASSVPVTFPGYTQEQVSQAFLGGIAAQSIYSSEERKDQPLPVPVPWGLQQVGSHVPTTTISHKPEPVPPSLSPSRGHATLPPKKSLSPSRMAFLSEQEKVHSQPAIVQYGGSKQSEKQENVIQQNKVSTISQILSASGAVSSSGTGGQRVSSPQSAIERWNIGQIDSHVPTSKSGVTEKIHMVQHKPRNTSSQSQHNVPLQFMHPNQSSFPRQLTQTEETTESGNSQGHMMSQGISADTGGLLRQQLMQKLQYQSNQDNSDLERNVFSAYKHAPSLPTSEASRLTPSPHTMLQQQHQARLERHREEVKMKGYTTISRNLDDKTDITQPPRIQIPQDIGLKGVLSPSMKELYPLPAHQDNRLSPASFPVSTIRRTPSPAHMPQEKRSPAPPSSLMEQEKVQPVNLSLQESHGNKLPFGGNMNYPQSSSLPVAGNVQVKQEDFTRYQSISPLSWLVTNQQHYHDNPLNPWQQQHYHTPDFSEIRDISPTPRQDDKGSPGPSQIISSIFAGGQKQSEILRQTLTSGLPPNVQLAKPANQQHQGLLSTTAPPVSQMGQLTNQSLISAGQTGYAMSAASNTKPVPTVRRFEGEIVKRVPQIPSPHSGQRPGRIEKDRTSPHRQVTPTGTDQNQPVSISGNQIRYTVQSSVSPVGKHDERRRTPSPKPGFNNRDFPGAQHGISVPPAGGMQPSYTQHDTKNKAASPKPGHVIKDGHYGADIPASLASSIVLPQNAGTIRQPFVNLVRLPMPKSEEHKTASTTISQLIQQKQQQQQQQQLLQRLQQQQQQQQHQHQQQQQTHGELPVFKQEPPHHALALPVSQALSQGQPQPMQPGKTINPFTFPSRPTTSASQRSVPAFDKYHGSSSVIQTQVSGSETMETKPRLFGRQNSESEMPRLDPIPPIHKIKAEKDDKRVKTEELVEMPNPFNMRLVNLANLPTSSVYRSTYRAHSLAVHRAKSGSIQSAAKSLDLLRQNLQKCINKELDAIIQKYMEKFFKPGINNIKLNNGENSVQEEHIQAVCRQILEEAKKMYVTEIPGLEQRSGCTPPRETDAWSDSGSNSGRRSVSTRKRRPSDTDSEKSHHAILKKKRGRPQLHSSGRVTPSKTLKPSEPVKREGPKWNPDRVTTSTLFVMGARANKALGLGATRGRIYIKHPDLFKYSGDQDDKQWLYENHRMPATGGKAYMLVLEDIQDLAQTDEYKDSPGLRIDDLVGFTIPDEMIEKVKGQMNALRTDLPQNRVKRSRSRSTTPSEMPTSQQENEEDADEPKSLPFASFTSPKITDTEKDDDQVSTADTEIEFLSGADNEDQNISNLSPFNLTGGFEEASPSSDMEGLDDDGAPLSAPFELRS